MNMRLVLKMVVNLSVLSMSDDAAEAEAAVFEEDVPAFSLFDSLVSMLLSEADLAIASASCLSSNAAVSLADALITSSSLTCDDNLAHGGSSVSGRKGVSVPVVPITKQFFLRSIVHWCFFNMSSPSNMSIGWSSRMEKLDVKKSFSI